MSIAYTQSMKAIGALWMGFRDQNRDFSVECHSRGTFRPPPSLESSIRNQRDQKLFFSGKSKKAKRSAIDN